MFSKIIHFHLLKQRVRKQRVRIVLHVNFSNVYEIIR
jgi:hypothetical protein